MDETSLEQAVEKGKKQIEEKDYENSLKERGFGNITKMVFAFKGKEFKIAVLQAWEVRFWGTPRIELLGRWGHVLVLLGHSGPSLLFKFLDDKECFQRPSVTKTLQKYYNFVTFERKYCERDAGVVILKRTCGFQDDCFEHQCG